MLTIIDANILIRLSEQTAASHQVAVDAIEVLLGRGHICRTVPQSLYEYWVVATRPAGKPSNGLGLSTGVVSTAIEDFERDFPLLNDLPSLYDDWRTLVQRYDVKGKPAHDARMAAALIGHRATHLLTFNARDFQRYAEFTVLKPDAVVAS